eukprot:546919-Rhodomonas_salina.2
MFDFGAQNLLFEGLLLGIWAEAPLASGSTIPCLSTGYPLARAISVQNIKLSTGHPLSSAISVQKNQGQYRTSPSMSIPVPGIAYRARTAG